MKPPLYPMSPPRPDIHAIDCDCPTCEPRVPSIDPPIGASGFVGWMFGGVALGNVVAVAIDPAGAAWAIRSALSHLIGAS